jgi:hypothetical protein
LSEIVELTVVILDSLVAACFLFGAAFYLMVAYGVRRGGMAWKIFGATGAIWFTIVYVKLIADMAGLAWIVGTARAIIALSLALFVYGLIALARMLKKAE